VLIDAYWRVHNGEIAEDSVAAHLEKHKPEVYRHHTQALSFIPDWLTSLHISGHSRRGHIRYTGNGPVSVRWHFVNAHSRSKRR